MPTVLSPNKGYPLQQTGENSGTWGVVLDGGISTTDLNMGGRLSLDVSGGGSVTLTATQASNLVYTFTGVLTGAKAVLFPAVGSFYIVRNQTTGAFALTIKTSAGGSVGPTIPQGATWAIFTDGTNGAQQQSGVAYGVDSGTAAAYVVTTDAGATATYPGSIVIWTAASTNTSPATMAVDGGAVKTLYQPAASGPIQAVAGYVVAGDTLISVYNPALNTGTGGWFTIGGIPSFSSITVADSLTITSTDAGASAAPVLEMYRNSATPASADLLGEMLWTGQNSTPVKATYSFIEARLDNPVAAAETATLLFATAQAGTVAARMGVAAGLTVGAPTGEDKGAGSINAASLYENGVQISTLLRPVPVRQTVLAGPLATDGSSNFGGATGGTTLTASATLIMTAANGFNGSGQIDRVGSIVNPAWTGLSVNGTIFLGVTIAADGTCTTTTTTSLSYPWNSVPSVSNNVYTFSIQRMQMLVGNGSVANQTYTVFVGDVTVAAGVVSAINWYALEGRYESTNTAVAISTSTTVNHNIGTLPLNVTTYLLCTTAANGYAVGQSIAFTDLAAPGNNSGGSSTALTTRSLTISTGNALAITPNGGGAKATIVTSNYAYVFTANRGW